MLKTSRTLARLHGGSLSPRLLTTPRVHSRTYHSIKVLQDAFKNPTSPFYIPPGTRGPAHEEDHEHALPSSSSEPSLLTVDAASTSSSPTTAPSGTSRTVVDFRHPHQDPRIAHEARERLLEMGYDPTSFWEQEIVWGDHDSFQHVNNVRYVRFFESGRIKWMHSLGLELGGPSKAEAMLRGKGVSLILKSVSVDFKRPVTYPDTLLIAHKPHFPPVRNKDHNSTSSTGGHAVEMRGRFPKTHMHVHAVAYSYAQERIVTESDSVLVWYDYARLAKCDPGAEVWKVVEGRMRGPGSGSEFS